MVLLGTGMFYSQIYYRFIEITLKCEYTFLNIIIDLLKILQYDFIEKNV